MTTKLDEVIANTDFRRVSVDTVHVLATLIHFLIKFNIMSWCMLSQLSITFCKDATPDLLSVVAI